MAFCDFCDFCVTQNIIVRVPHTNIVRVSYALIYDTLHRRKDIVGVEVHQYAKM